jgi:hypothetical protein
MARVARIVTRGRALPWWAVLEVLQRLKRCYDALTPKERAEVRDLLRKARTQRGKLSERDRRTVAALGRKCFAAARKSK